MVKNTEQATLIGRYILLRILIIVVISYFVASYLDLFETIAEFVEGHEEYNLDELIVVAGILSIWLIIELVCMIKRSVDISNRHLAASLQDPLTGLLNRRGFFDYDLAENIKLHCSESVKGYLVYIDVRNFKYYNDTYGHSYGDQLLITISNHLSKSINTTDTAARIGGDEFVLIVYRTDDEIEYLKDHLHRSISLNNFSSPLDDSVLLDFGITKIDLQESDLDRILIMADKQMYKTKEKTTLT